MSQFNSPKPLHSPRNLPLISASTGFMAFLFSQFVLEDAIGWLFGEAFGLALVLLSAVTAILVWKRKFLPAIILAATPLPFLIITVIWEVSKGIGNPSDLVNFLVHVVMIAAAVMTVVFSIQERSKLQRIAPRNASGSDEVLLQGTSDRKWVTALLLSLFFGLLGFDRLYVGRTGLAIAKLLTAGGLGVWALVDFIMLCVGKMPDVHGRPLQR